LADFNGKECVEDTVKFTRGDEINTNKHLDCYTKLWSGRSEGKRLIHSYIYALPAFDTMLFLRKNLQCTTMITLVAYACIQNTIQHVLSADKNVYDLIHKW
jgi:hypothetical protein